MNIIQIYQRFPTERHCIEYLEKTRWPEGAVCPYCHSGKSSKLKGRHHCNACNKSYSVTVGTIFHHTHLPLQKWFLALTLITNAKKGLSARQLARDIEVGKNTAWKMAMRIRAAMKQTGGVLEGVIEMDETYIGGKGSSKKTSRAGRGTSKTTIVGMVAQKGEVRAFVQEKTQLNFDGLSSLAKENVNFEKSMIITDEYTGYSRFHTLGRHKTINHSERYVDCLVHTNTIEGFWSGLKRGIKGQHHSVSKAYLQNYIDERAFMYNNRKNPNIWQTLVERAVA